MNKFIDHVEFLSRPEAIFSKIFLSESNALIELALNIVSAGKATVPCREADPLTAEIILVFPFIAASATATFLPTPTALPAAANEFLERYPSIAIQ